MAISAGVALISTAAGVAVGTIAVSSALTYFLVTTAMGAALNALAPKPDTSLGQANRGYQVTQRAAAADRQIIYGQTRVGGIVIYDGITGTDNKYLHRVVAFAGHEIKEFTTFYFNDEAVTIDGSGDVTSPSNYSGFVRINSHLGTAAQTADSDLVSEVTEWTNNHKLSGVAYAYFRFKYDEDAFPNGLPDISAVIKGKKVYDPRTATTAWSDNPALCIRDYLVSDYGLNEDTARIDDALVSTAANVCDWINYPANTVGPRFTMNGAFLTSSTPHDNLMSLLTSMGGMLWYSQGQWRMKPAYYTSPVLTLTEDDLRSSISVSTRHSRRDNFNIVKGVFRGADTNYQPTDYAEVTNITDDGDFFVGQPYAITELGTTNWNTVAGTTGVTYAVGDVIVAAATGGGGDGKANYWLGVDGGQESVVDLNLSFTDDFDICRRIARIYLERNRQQITVQASFGLRAFQCQVGDIVQITNSRFGWTLKKFEVVNWNFGLQEGLDLQVNLTLREISANVFNEVDDGAVLELDNTNLDSPFDVQTPFLEAAVVTAQVNNDGTTVPIITFSWGVNNPSLVQYYEFQWKITGDTEYNTRLVREGEYTLAPAISGVSYDYRVRAVNHLSVKSQWVNAVTPAATGDDGTTPNAPTSPVVVGGYRTATVYWTDPTENTDSSTLTDLLHYEVYRGTSTNPTTLIARVASNRFTDGDLLDNITYYYRVKAVDRSLNKSDFSDNASAATQAQIADGVNGTNVATVYLFNKNTSNSSAPSNPSGTFTYTFSTGVLSGGTLNGWTQTPPSLSEGEYLWVIVATASSITSTDSIPASEFTEATIYGQGTAAYRSAVVTLFKKNTSGATPPSDPTGPFTYTFATNALSGGTLSGWSQSAPSLGKGEYLWSISATAFAQTATDTVNTSDFGDAVVVGIGGEDGGDGSKGDAGDTGDSVVTGKVYYGTLQSSSPSTPSATSFNKSTGEFTGLTSGWSLTQPSVSITDTTVYEWSSQFVVIIDGVTSDQVITFTTPASAIQVTTDIESDNYVEGTSGWKLERDTGDIFVNNGTFRGDITLGGRLDSSIFNHFYGYIQIGPVGVSSSFTYTTVTDDFDNTATATGLDANANYLLIDFKPYIVQRMYNCAVSSWGGFVYQVGELQYYNSSNTWQTACIWWDNVGNISDRDDNDLNAKPARYMTPIVGRGLDGVLDMGSIGRFRLKSYLSDTEPSPKNDPFVYHKFMESNSAGNMSGGQVETKTVTYLYENNDGSGSNGSARHGVGFSGKLIQVNDRVLPSGGGYSYLGTYGGIGN